MSAFPKRKSRRAEAIQNSIRARSQNWLYCSITAPKTGKRRIKFRATNNPMRQNATTARKSGFSSAATIRGRRLCSAPLFATSAFMEISYEMSPAHAWVAEPRQLVHCDFATNGRRSPVSFPRAAQCGRSQSSIIKYKFHKRKFHHPKVPLKDATLVGDSGGNFRAKRTCRY
jgi:hypothetical protein